MKHFTHLKQNLTRATMTLLLALLTAASAWATDYISDVMVIGGSKTETNNLKTTLTEQGWTVIEQDLNADAGGDYIYLLYKIESSSNNLNWGYITDFYISNSTGTAPDEITHNERTYHLVPYDGGTDFINSKGDLNRGAGGAYIHLYYTTDLFTDNRTVSGITFNATQSGAVGVNGGTTGYDLNSGAGGKYIYMHVTTTIANPPLAGQGTADSPFLIGTAAEWTFFATMIEYEPYVEKCYKMTADINVTTMVGTSANPFTGTFDGNGKTLTVNVSGSEQGVAPFHYIDGATIQNLTVGGTVTGSAYHAAGLVGFCSDTNTVTNCAVTTNVSASGYGGGIVGHGASSTLILSNSYYSGTISDFGNYAGGLLGWCDAMTLTMDNCLFKGAFTPSGSGKYHPIACANNGSTVTATVTNTFYLNALTPTATVDKIIPEAEGTPVSTTLIEGSWDIPVMAADGLVYYLFFTGKRLPYSYGFENNDLDAEGWTIVNRRNNTGIAKGSAFSGMYFFIFDSYDQENTSQYLISPEFKGLQPTTMSFSYSSRTQGPPAFQVGYSTTTNDIDAFNWLAPVIIEGWEDECYEMNFPIGIKYYAIRCLPSEYTMFYLDDLNFTVCVLPCPFNLAANEITDHSATITWTIPESSDSITGYAYQYKKNSDDDWQDEVTVNGDVTSVYLSSLSALTDYQFRVKALGAESQSIYNNVSFTTGTMLPYECGFENGMDGWGMVDCNYRFADLVTNYDYRIYTGIRKQAHHDGDVGFQFWRYTFNEVSKHQHLISPLFFEMSPITVSFYYRNDGGAGHPETFQVGYSTTTSDVDAFTWGSAITSRDGQWMRYDSDPFPVGTRYVALKLITNEYALYVDDFSFEVYSLYTKPADLAISNLTPQGATLTWACPDATTIGYAYQYRQVNGSWSVQDTLSLTSVTLSGLTPNTEYDFRVKALYSENNASNYVSTRFMTEGETESLPHYQSFENGMGGWRTMNCTGFTGIRTYPAYDGEHCFYFARGQYNNTQYLISPQLSSSTSSLFEFYFMNYVEYGDDTTSYPARIQIGYSNTTKDLDAFTWSDDLKCNQMTWFRVLYRCAKCPKYIAIAFTRGEVLYLDGFRILPACFPSVIGYGESEGGWTFIASPVEGSVVPTEVEYLITDTENEYDLYRFNQSATKEWENYKAHTDDFVLENGKGYLYARKDSKKLIFSGELTSGTTKTIELDYDSNAEFKGWNLVGNPFPERVTVNRSFYTMNEDGTGINPQPVSAGGTIAACMGILVQAEGPNESVTFHNYSRETMESNGLLRIAVGNNDQAIVSFNPGDQLGKFYFGEQDANIYIPQGNKEYAIACSDGQGEMPVNFKAKKNGTYTITINPEGVEMGYLHLIDNMTGADIDLLAAKVPELVAGPTLNDVFNSVESSFSTGSTTSYTFTAKTTDYESRFKLVFSANNEDGPSMGSRTFAFVSNGEIIITGIDGDACNASLQVIDVLGHVVVCRDASNASAISTSGLTPGVYMLRLINGDDIRTQKIVIE